MCSDFLGKKNAQKRMPFCHAFTFFNFPHVLGAAGVFPVSFFHVFGCWLHFSHGWEVVFVVLGIGLSSSRFGSCWAFSHSRFLWIHVFLPWLGRAIHVFYCLSNFWASRTGYLGRFSLLWVGFPDKLQDCVFFPHVVSHFCCYVWGCAIRFPCLSCESWINFRSAIVGFQTVWGVRILAWLLDKPGVRNHTGRTRGLTFFSITPE